MLARSDLAAIDRLENERLTDLQLIRYQEIPVEDEKIDYNLLCPVMLKAFR